MFNSPFEKLTVDNQNAMAANTAAIAVSVNSGGAMFDIFTKMLTTLKQIEKNTRIKNKGGKDTKGGLGIKNAIALKIIGPKGLTGIGKGLGVIAESLKQFGKPKDIIEKMQAIATGMVILEGVGRSILNFAKWLVLASPLLVVAALVTPLIGFVLIGILTILALVGRIMPKRKLLQTFIMLRMVGKGIFMFGAYLALSLLVYPYAIAALPMVALVILGVGMIFFLLDKLNIDKSMRKMGRALTMAALGILSLAVSIALFSLIMSSVGDPWETLLLVGAVVLGVGLAFWLIGKGATEIFKGSLAMLVVGVVLIVLGLGVKIMTAAVPDMTTALGMIGLIAGLGATFALIGAYEAGLMTGIPLTITMGSVAMIVAGLALLFLAPGVLAITSVTKDLTLEQVGFTALLIVGLGAAMAGAGLVAPLILIGSGAIIAAGLALLSVGKGLQAMSKVFQSGGVDKMLADSGHITQPFLGFGGGRTMSKMEWLLQSLAYSFAINPIMIGSMYNSADALILAGDSLVSIAKGINEFEKIAAKTDLAKLGENVAIITGTLANIFGELGVKFPGGRKSLYNRIFGGGTQSPVADGISSVMGMADALTSIAIGMQQMANLKFPTKYDKNGKPVEFETMSSDAPAKVAANTVMITDALAGVFGKIGSDPKLGKGGKKGLFSQILSGSGQSPVADGISSVMGMGDALTGIALGFQAMADLKFPIAWNKEGKPTKFESVDIPSAVKKVLANTTLILLGEDGATGGLVGMLSSIGKAGGPDKGLFTSTDYEKGREMIQGIGTPIKELAEGVKNMAELRFANKWDKNGKAIGWVSHSGVAAKLKQVEANIKLILLGSDGTGGLVGIFKKIGGEDESGWFSSSTIEKGADIAAMISKPIKDIADAAEQLMSDKWSPEGASERIGAIIKALASGGETLQAGGLWGKGSNPLEETAKFLKAIAEQVDPFEKFTKSFGNYVEDFVKYKDAINAFDPDKLKLTNDMFTGLTYLSKTEDAINNMSEQLAAAIYKLAEMIESTNGGTSTEGAEQPAGANPALTSSPAGEKGDGGKVDMSAVVKAIQLLESRLDEPITVKAQSSSWFS